MSLTNIVGVISPNPDERIEFLDSIADKLGSDNSLLPWLKSMAYNDKSEAVRKRAWEILVNTNGSIENLALEESDEIRYETARAFSIKLGAQEAVWLQQWVLSLTSFDWKKREIALTVLYWQVREFGVVIDNVKEALFQLTIDEFEWKCLKRVIMCLTLFIEDERVQAVLEENSKQSRETRFAIWESIAPFNVTDAVEAYLDAALNNEINSIDSGHHQFAQHKLNLTTQMLATRARFICVPNNLEYVKTMLKVREYSGYHGKKNVLAQLSDKHIKSDAVRELLVSAFLGNSGTAPENSDDTKFRETVIDLLKPHAKSLWPLLSAKLESLKTTEGSQEPIRRAHITNDAFLLASEVFEDFPEIRSFVLEQISPETEKDVCRFVMELFLPEHEESDVKEKLESLVESDSEWHRIIAARHLARFQSVPGLLDVAKEQLKTGNYTISCLHVLCDLDVYEDWIINLAISLYKQENEKENPNFYNEWISLQPLMLSPNEYLLNPCLELMVKYYDRNNDAKSTFLAGFEEKDSSKLKAVVRAAMLMLEREEIVEMLFNLHDTHQNRYVKKDIILGFCKHLENDKLREFLGTALQNITSEDEEVWNALMNHMLPSSPEDIGDNWVPERQTYDLLMQHVPRFYSWKESWDSALLNKDYLKRDTYRRAMFPMIAKLCRSIRKQQTKETLVRRLSDV